MLELSLFSYDFFFCSEGIQGSCLANGCVNLMAESLEGDFHKYPLHAYNQRKFLKTKRSRTLSIKYKFS